MVALYNEMKQDPSKIQDKYKQIHEKIRINKILEKDLQLLSLQNNETKDI